MLEAIETAITRLAGAAAKALTEAPEAQALAIAVKDLTAARSIIINDDKILTQLDKMRKEHEAGHAGDQGTIIDMRGMN